MRGSLPAFVGLVLCVALANAPLSPLQGFAIGLGSFALVLLLLLAGTQRRFH